MDGETAFSGKLATKLIKKRSMRKNIIIKIPGLGRFGLVFDKHGESTRFPGGLEFNSNLSVEHFNDAGRLVDYRNLGSGLTTNVGALALANDGFWSATNALNNLFRFMKYHATGTGATAAAATDIKLQTASASGGQTPVAAVNTLVSAANAQKITSVATIAYTGTEAVTEWGLFAYDSTLPAVTNLSDATGTPFTAGSGTTGTVTATPLTASSSTVMGQQMSIFENTGNATPSWGLVTANTTSVVTVPAWYKVADGTAGANPANGNAYVIRPIMWDHKVFSAVNVNNGDSIQFTYTLTVASGG